MTARTETADARFAEVETWDDAAILAAIADGQAAAVAACRAALPDLARAAGALADAWRGGGRIAYAGAGSSGLISLLDGLELPCTFGLDPARIPFLIAGGVGPFTALDQGSEDDEATARAEVACLGLGPGDAVVASSASGGTPYTVAAAQAARAAGAAVVGIACNAGTPLLLTADVPVALLTPPEVVAGSTRLNAGTATKCALNMLSTLLGMRLGHVYRGLMVNVQAENAKLHDRAARIVAQAAGVDEAVAREALALTRMAVKPAVLVARGADPQAAQALLAAHAGDLRRAIARP